LAAAARMRDLAPGYPWAVETRGLGLDAAPGVAVVLGLFQHARDAQAWVDARAANAALQVVSVARDVPGGARVVPAVTQVIGRAPVAAYTASAVARIESALERSGEEAPTGVAFARSTALATRGVRPACRIAPGSVFANVGHAYAAPEIPYAGHRAWHAVRCPNGVAAWVPLAATQATAVVWTHRDGGVRVTQVSLVECDSATLTTWRLGPNGERNAWRRELPGGC